MRNGLSREPGLILLCIRYRLSYFFPTSLLTIPALSVIGPDNFAIVFTSVRVLFIS